MMKFIDLFAGMGGFRLAFEKQGCKCVFSSEIDAHAIQTYQSNFNDIPAGDITKIAARDIPDFDILCAGFPCQPFSLAGKRKGFDDTRGTLFFDIARILSEKKPMAAILENVKGITNHNSGKTIQTILDVLDKIGYSCKYSVLNSSDFGVPQSRERWYCICIRKDLCISANNFSFPEKKNEKILFADILETQVSKKYKISKKCESNIQKFLKEKNIQITENLLAYDIRPSRCQFKSNGIAPTLTAKMGTGGNNIPVLVKDMRFLTERECLSIMGYPKSYKITTGSHVYNQIGNSVCVPVINLLAENLVSLLISEDKKN